MAAKKESAGVVHPYRVQAFVDVNVMDVVRLAVEAAYPEREVDQLRVDVDRLFDSDYPSEGEPWAIPVSFELYEL